MCACTGMYLCVGVCRCVRAYTLQVPMQPTGLSGRPLNPSFLLMARKRYACRDTQTHTHVHILTYRHLSLNTTFRLHRILQPIWFQRKLKAAFLYVLFPLHLLSIASSIKKYIFDLKCHAVQFVYSMS